ncbi:MAG: hypothetical protein K2G54_01250, partial [Malacoplasma sp.]|nr:hypothetical protein [Malacoplasma sp.]
YGEFKTKVADVTCNFIESIQEKYFFYFNNKELEEKLNKNAKLCNEIANRKINFVQNALGLGEFKG